MQTIPNLRKKLLLIITLLFNTAIFAQWTNLTPSLNFKFNDLSFPTLTNGYALIDSSSSFSSKYIFKTQDAGINWQELSAKFTPNTETNPLSNIRMIDIFFPTTDIGFIQISGNLFSGGNKNFVFKTIDGGLNWEDKTPKNFTNPGDLYFFNTDGGYISGGDALFKTTDGGDNWNEQKWPLTNPPNISKIDFYDLKNGIAAGWDFSFSFKGIIYTTTDGGLNWNSLFIDVSNTDIVAVDYTENNTAFALTKRGFNNIQRMYKTTNNGSTWDTLFVSTVLGSDEAKDVKFVNDKEGYLSTKEGEVYITADGGLNWTVDYTHSKGELNTMALDPDNNLYVAGAISTLLKKTAMITGVENFLEISENLSIYPNPNTTDGVINFKTEFTGNIDLINIHGKLIYSEKLRSAKQLELAKINLSPGVYFLNMSGNRNDIEKIIIN